jgi:micrococcal nuclease
MAKQQRRQKPKYSIATLVLLLVIALYYNYWVKDADVKPPVEHRRTEAPEKLAKKYKAPKKRANLRKLTVFTGKVVGVKDGDTYEILYDGQAERVRLADIDCPEKSQAFGNNAKQYASDLCFGKTVTVTCDAKRDRYGRLIGTVVTNSGVNVNEALVKAGFAWHYKQYSKSEEIGDIETAARKSKVGLWADVNPTPPWDYRKAKRKKN